jgi:tetratricopeptide (TPR) repeat protein
LVGFAYDLLVNGSHLPARVTLPAPLRSPAELQQKAEESIALGNGPAAIEYAEALLRCQPDSGEARSLLGQGYLLAGHPAHAVLYFMSALRGREREARCWLDVGSALRAKGDPVAALAAYKAALGLDAGAIDGWIAIAEMARAKGVDDLAAEAIGVARRIDAHHPRLASLAF